VKILVISDTHITSPADDFPDTLSRQIKQCDYCFHAGDFAIYWAYKKISQQIKTYAVAGNMDDQQIQKTLPLKQTINIGGFSFGLIHGRGSPNTLGQYIEYQFQKNYKNIDLFIFGHSHQPTDIERNGKIYFNPGSAGDTITGKVRTYGILEINGTQLKRRIEKIG